MGEYTSGVWKLEIKSHTSFLPRAEQREGQEAAHARYIPRAARLWPSGTRAKLLPWLLEEGCAQENFSMKIYSVLSPET